jgi:hypothetical protein
MTGAKKNSKRTTPKKKESKRNKRKRKKRTVRLSLYEGGGRGVRLSVFEDGWYASRLRLLGLLKTDIDLTAANKDLQLFSTERFRPFEPLPKNSLNQNKQDEGNRNHMHNYPPPPSILYIRSSATSLSGLFSIFSIYGHHHTKSAQKLSGSKFRNPFSLFRKSAPHKKDFQDIRNNHANFGRDRQS